MFDRESPLMFYVLRMAEPQFFVVFRQIKHREEVGFYIVHCAIIAIKICVENFFNFAEVVQSPGFQETVSKYGLTFSNSRSLILK